MTNAPRFIGLDGGASKVRGIVIKPQGSDTFIRDSEAVTRSYSESEYYLRKFQPVNLAQQMEDFNTGSIHPTPEETRQEAAIIQSFTAVIHRLSAQHPIRIGIGLPGLKTESGMGIAVMANGPRMPHFVRRLTSELNRSVVQLDGFPPPIGNDSDFCGLGEEFAREGNFRQVTNAYYLGGGTGAAEALKLSGELIPFTSTGNWMPKLWELEDENGIPLEYYASMEGIQTLYAKERGQDPENAGVIFSLAMKGDDFAQNFLEHIASRLAMLFYERIVTLYSGWQNLFLLRPFAQRKLIQDHPYRNSVYHRLVIGQRLSTLFQQSKETGIFFSPLLAELKRLISGSPVLPNKAKHYYETGLEKDFIRFSDLHIAPALGAGIYVWQHWKKS